jgi:EmrB/QacA subfamily drug resistance transporter
MTATLAPPRPAGPTTATPAPAPRSQPDRVRVRPAPANRWATLAVLCLSLLVIVVDTTIVNVALPTLARQLHATTSGLQWIVDGYTLAFASLLLLAGALADRFGRHRALAAGLAAFAIASLIAALTRTTSELIAARAAMGVAAAFIMPATLSVLTSVFTDRAERARAIGLWAAVSGLGVAIGPVAGGWLLAHFSWDSIFLVNLPIAGVALAAGRWLVPASRAPVPRRLDLAGAALSVTAFAALTYTLIQAPADGWTSVATIARAAAAAGLLAAFVAWEARSSAPMLPLALFRDRAFAGAAAAIMLLFFALTGGVFLLTQIYQFVLGYSPLAAGVRTLPSAALLAVASPAGARIARRFGTRVPVVAGLTLMTGGLALFATATAAATYSHYVTAMIILSAGMGLAMAPATESVMHRLPPALAGVGSAVNDATRNLGSVLGVAVVGSVAASAYTSHLGAFHAAGPAATAAARQSVGAAAAIARQVGGPHGAALFHTAATAFVTGTDRGALVAAAATLTGVIVAARALRGGTAAPSHAMEGRTATS